MKTIIKALFPTSKDIIALIIVVIYCISFLLTAVIPGIEFNEIMSRQYERVLLMVVGFYFGSHQSKKIQRCPDCDKP